MKIDDIHSDEVGFLLCPICNINCVRLVDISFNYGEKHIANTTNFICKNGHFFEYEFVFDEVDGRTSIFTQIETKDEKKILLK